MAKVYIRLNRFEQAIDVSYKALAIDPKLVSSHIDLAAALFRHERHEASEHHARRALELAPEAVEPWLHLGNSLSAAGRMDEAAEAFLKIAGRPPFGIMALARLVHNPRRGLSHSSGKAGSPTVWDALLKGLDIGEVGST